MSTPILVDCPPDDDEVEHVGGERCVCKPYRQPLDNPRHGPRTFAIVHFRLDGKDLEL